MKLLINALIKYLSGLVAMGLLIFLPAGTLNYPGGWLLTGLLFGPMLLLGAALLLKAPGLLEKRLNAREKMGGQKRVVSLTALAFLISLPLAGLDFRFGWSQLPAWLVAAACAVLILSYALYAEVMRENVWLSRTIEVQQGQKVVDTGLYGVVRHPMYSASVLMFLAMPIVLSSAWAVLPMLAYPALIVSRIHGEEQLLKNELPGYSAYMQKVRYRLIPFIW